MNGTVSSQPADWSAGEGSKVPEPPAPEGSQAADDSAYSAELSHRINQFLTRQEKNCSEPEDEHITALLSPQSSLLSSLSGTEPSLAGQTAKESPEPPLDWLGLERAFQQSSPAGYCPIAWDGVTCWHRTAAGQKATVSCFEHLFGIRYDPSGNASRLCHLNGTWANRSDYDNCKVIDTLTESPPYDHLYNTQHIYYAGYGLSLCALTLALWIFLYFKDLRCVRNHIHTNLMVTYLLNAICWIFIYSIPLSRSLSCYLFVMSLYLLTTNFFWMFVEGLYLYILVVKTFSIEFVKTYIYHAIGWGIPAIVVLVWAITKSYLGKVGPVDECSFQVGDGLDYIYKAPILIVLVVNIFFLCKVMWVLISKLQNTSASERKQYRKASKALLVLIPLLGVGYLFVLVTPTEKNLEVIFKYLQAILGSTQGFIVAVLYCFCNGEVRNSLRHKIERCRLQRGDNFPNSSSYYRTSAYYSRQNTIQSQKIRFGNGNGAGNGRQNGPAGPQAKRQTYGFKALAHSKHSPKSSFSEASTMQTSFTSMASTVLQANGNGNSQPAAAPQRRASEALHKTHCSEHGDCRKSSVGGRRSAPEAGLSSSLLSSSATATPSAGGLTPGGPRERRADSCVCFTTNATYVMLAERNNNNHSPATASLQHSRRKSPSNYSSPGYQTVSNTPEEDEYTVELEMKAV